MRSRLSGTTIFKLIETRTLSKLHSRLREIQCFAARPRTHKLPVIETCVLVYAKRPFSKCPRTEASQNRALAWAKMQFFDAQPSAHKLPIIETCVLVCAERPFSSPPKPGHFPKCAVAYAKRNFLTCSLSCTNRPLTEHSQYSRLCEFNRVH